MHLKLAFCVLSVVLAGACGNASAPAQRAATEGVHIAPWARFDLPILSAGSNLQADVQRLSRCLAVAGDNEPDRCIGVIGDACLDADKEGSTASQVGCLGRETAAWETRMTEQVQRLSSTSDEIKTATGKAQAAFLAYREAECLLPYVVNEGGTIAHVLSAGCANELTAQQALRLQAETSMLAEDGAK